MSPLGIGVIALGVLALLGGGAVALKKRVAPAQNGSTKSLSTTTDDVSPDRSPVTRLGGAQSGGSGGALPTSDPSAYAPTPSPVAPPVGGGSAMVVPHFMNPSAGIHAPRTISSSPGIRAPRVVRPSTGSGASAQMVISGFSIGHMTKPQSRIARGRR